MKPAATAATCGTKTLAIADASVMKSSDHRRLSSVTPGRSSGSVVWVRAVVSRRAIGGLASARRPNQMPISTAPAHQTAQKIASVPSPSRARPMTVRAASSVAAPAFSRTVALRKSPKRTGSVEQSLEQLADAVGPVDHHVGLARQRRRPLVRPHADPHGCAQAAPPRRAR